MNQSAARTEKDRDPSQRQAGRRIEKAGRSRENMVQAEYEEWRKRQRERRRYGRRYKMAVAEESEAAYSRAGKKVVQVQYMRECTVRERRKGCYG